MIWAAGALLVLFLAILWQVQTGGWLVSLDGAVNAALGAVRTRAVLGAAGWISQVGTGAAGIFLGLVASGLMLGGERERYIVPFWVTLAGAQATTWSLKFITKRVRPEFLEGITAGSPSFPSAHATVSMAVYLYIVLVISAGLATGRVWVYGAAGLIILAICVSRLVLSLHYLSDVLAGAAVGLFWALVGWQLATSA